MVTDYYKGFRLFLRDILQLTRPVLFLSFLLFIGSEGYILIEEWDVIDALYMTVITITTVGFGEVRQLSPSGKIFTITLILGGVVFYGLSIDSLLRFFVGTRFRGYVKVAKMNEKIKKLNNHYIICGGGRMALAIAHEFERSGKEFVIIESNPDSPSLKMSRAGVNNWLIMERDALLEESLVEAGIEHASGLASVLPTDADNLFVVLSARKLNPKLRIETRISQESTRGKMLQAGANKVVSPFSIGGLQMARSFLSPQVDEFMEIIMDQANYEFEMKIHHINAGDKYTNHSLRESSFREDGYVVIGVKTHDGEMVFAPQSDYVLKEGMEILLVGSGKKKPLV